MCVLSCLVLSEAHARSCVSFVTLLILRSVRLNTYGSPRRLSKSSRNSNSRERRVVVGVVMGTGVMDVTGAVAVVGDAVVVGDVVVARWSILSDFVFTGIRKKKRYPGM